MKSETKIKNLENLGCSGESFTGIRPDIGYQK